MSQPPQPPPPPLNAPTINPPILQQSLTSLYPLSEILQRLHHRNKNQHSSSLWYSSFDILRRNVAKLVSEIETCLDNAPPEGDNRKVNKVRAEKARKWDHQGVEKVRKRAGFVKHEMVKGCWVRFGGLVGDRQFAQVGLVLMGVLGGVNTVVQGLVGEEGGTEGEGEEIIREGGQEGEIDGVGEGMEEVGMDMGVAVARGEEKEEVDNGVVVVAREVEEEEVIPSVERDILITATATPTRRTKKLAKRGVAELPIEDDGTPPKKKKKSGDEFDDIFGGFDSKKSKKEKKSVKKEDTPPSDGTDGNDDRDNLPEPEPLPKKKKKKAIPANVEFDGIFSGLGSDNKPKKKKTKQIAGDEFDDIFSGLGGVDDEKPKKKTSGGVVTKKKKKKGGDEFDDIFAGF